VDACDTAGVVTRPEGNGNRRCNSGEASALEPDYLPARTAIKASERGKNFALVFVSQFAFAFAAVIGFVLAVVTFWPGYMSTDSFIQLMQARTHSYTDWHPPVMSWLWAQLDLVLPGPGGMLILHNLCFWSALAIIARNCFRSSAAALLVLAIGFLPPVFGLLSTIWKDVGLGAMLLLAFALLQGANIHRSRPWLWGALLPLAYGALVRHNGLFAVLPLALWWGKLAMEIHRWSWTRRWVLIGAALFVALVLLSRTVNWVLTGGRTEYLQQVIMLHDLAAISIARHQNLLPDYLRSGPRALSLERLAQIYHPSNTVPLWCCDGQRIPLSLDPFEVRQLMEQWFESVSTNPSVYLRHRWIMASSQFAIGSSTVALPFYNGIEENALGLRFTPGRWNTWVMGRLEAIKYSLLFRGWVYVLAIVLSVAVCRWFRRENFETAMALGSSGLLYALASFPIAPIGDFRLLWWTVLAAWMLPLVVLSTVQHSVPLAEGASPQLGIEAVDRLRQESPL
jgi:hypothetical protein